MDSFTHLITGAVICDALPFTKKLGPKAPLVAAIAAAAPDIDMAPALFANFPWRELSFHGLFDMELVMRYHRAYTHSFFYMALASVPLAWLAWRWSGRKGPVWQWFALLIPAFFSHTILDLTNVWGARAWLPFSESKSAFGVLPLYDIPIILICLATILVNHLFRDSYPDSLHPVVHADWREKIASRLNRLASATTVGAIGLALVIGRIGWALYNAPTLRGWF